MASGQQGLSANEMGPAPGHAVGRTIVHVVPHTHWDREWYLPFQTFRMRLVQLVDGLLDELEADPRARFTLDGQTATVEDYLEIRPGNAIRIASLVRDGRLAIGPWRILMDEYLVSGETIVRNLEQGVRQAAELGGEMRVGYLPDMFGHVAQMPQILRRAGMGDAVVWRGVPQVIDGHVFDWFAPDGTAVRVEYLCGGYGNARDLVAQPTRIERKLDVLVAAMRPWFGGDEVLAMYGEDHAFPAAGLASQIERFNSDQDRYEARIETLREYLDATRDRSRPTRTWHGELRSSARANVLMGVTSHRIEVKQAAARAERWLERGAEPLIAVHGTTWPEAFLGLAWRRVVENSAHDSICACSSEETVQQVLARYAEAEQVARGLVAQTLAEIGTRIPAGAWVVWNPSPSPRSDLVEVELPTGRPVDLALPDGARIPTQVLDINGSVLDDREIPALNVVAYLRNRMHARELYGHLVNGYAIAPALAGRLSVLDVDVARVGDPPMLDVDALLDRLESEAAAADVAAPGVTWRMRIASRPSRRLLARVSIAALGWTTLVERDRERALVPEDVDDPVRADSRSLANALVSVAIEPDGTLELVGAAGRLTDLGRIVGGGDCGDSYNYAPPARDVVVERPVATRIEPGEVGPLRGCLTVLRTYEWPAGLTGDGAARLDRRLVVETRTHVELRSGEPFVRLRVEFENPAVDHRVRFHIALPGIVTGSYAEGQFAVVPRGLTQEGGHGGRPLPTFPAHGLVATDGAAVLLDHVVEYEVVDGRELAITLLRATGLISRDVHPWRSEPTGPVIAAPTGQGLGPRTVSFAVLPWRDQSGDGPGPSLLADLERYRNPFRATLGTGPSDAVPRSVPGLSVAGEGIVFSSLRRHGNGLVLRLVNETGDPRPAIVAGPFSAACRSDILGRPGGSLPLDHQGRLRLLLKPWEICTLRLIP